VTHSLRFDVEGTHRHFVVAQRDHSAAFLRSPRCNDVSALEPRRMLPDQAAPLWRAIATEAAVGAICGRVSYDPSPSGSAMLGRLLKAKRRSISWHF